MKRKIAVAASVVIVYSANAWSESLNQAKALFNRGQYVQSYAITESLAEKGNKEAMEMMYELHRGAWRDSLGITPEANKALYWAEKLAGTGDVQRMADTATFYHFGRGTKKDYEQSLYWLHKCSNLSHAGCTFLLYQAYKFGQGLPVDPAKAEALLTAAVALGSESAQKVLDDRTGAWKKQYAEIRNPEPLAAFQGEWGLTSKTTSEFTCSLAKAGEEIWNAWTISAPSGTQVTIQEQRGKETPSLTGEFDPGSQTLLVEQTFGSAMTITYRLKAAANKITGSKLVDYHQNDCYVRALVKGVPL